MRPRQPLRARLAVVLGGRLATGCARGVLEVRELGLERKLARHGLVEDTVRLGPHEIHRWRSEEVGRAGDEAADETADEGLAVGTEPGARPVVLLHGFGPPALWQWHPQIAPVSRCRPVLMLDLLGFGDSSSTPGGPTLDTQVDAIVDLLDAQGMSRVDVVGVSYGGMVAMELALRVPDRIASLVLVSSPGRAFEADDQRPLVRAHGVSGMADLLLPRDGPEVDRLLSVAYAHPPRVPPALLDDVADSLYAHRRREKTEILRQIPRDYDAVAEQSWRLEVPTLVVWGAEDQIFPIASGLRLMSQLETGLGAPARMVVVPGAGHVPNLERPRAFNRTLLDWLDCERVDRRERGG